MTASPSSPASPAARPAASPRRGQPGPCPGGTRRAVNGAAIAVVVGVLKLTFTACLAYGTSTATLVGPVARREGRRQGGALRGLGRPRACHLRPSDRVPARGGLRPVQSSWAFAQPSSELGAAEPAYWPLRDHGLAARRSSVPLGMILATQKRSIGATATAAYVLRRRASSSTSPAWCRCLDLGLTFCCSSCAVVRAWHVVLAVHVMGLKFRSGD
jgi:hypothetical protein